MRTRVSIGGLAAFAGGLLLAVPVLGWAASDWGPGGVPGALERCELALEQCITFPGDGWPADSPDYAIPGGAPLSYAGPGEISADYPPEGTFVDLNTKLMWEIKTGTVGDPVDCTVNPLMCIGGHNVNFRYDWSETGSTEPDGLAFTLHLMNLNHTCGGDGGYVSYCYDDADCAGEPIKHCGLGGHMDWRLPTVKELQSLVDYSVPYPGPVVAAGLPGATAPSYYWSSTADAINDGNAWHVNFYGGYVTITGKDFDVHVRAVRGGW